MIANLPLLLKKRNENYDAIKKDEFLYHGGNTNVRRTEKANTRTTPIGASADAGSGKGTQGKNKAAHTRGCDIGESISAGNHDEP